MFKPLSCSATLDPTAPDGSRERDVGFDWPKRITPTTDCREYLQHHVKDVGLGASFDRMIPLVEWTSTTNLNRVPGGVLQFHLYLDDLFPNSIVKPLFGG